jgi:hypothetical protein
MVPNLWGHVVFEEATGQSPREPSVDDDIDSILETEEDADIDDLLDLDL